MLRTEAWAGRGSKERCRGWGRGGGVGWGRGGGGRGWGGGGGGRGGAGGAGRRGEAPRRHRPGWNGSGAAEGGGGGEPVPGEWTLAGTGCPEGGWGENGHGRC